jgi:HEAT repeat protein
MSLRILAAVVLSLALSQAANATQNIAADIGTLKTSSDTRQLFDACNRLVSSLFVTTPILAKVSSSPNGPAALAALKTFVLSGRNSVARIRCARPLAQATMQSVDPAHFSVTYSPYAEQANAIVLSLFGDPDPEIRVGAANALWGIHNAIDGRALLMHANSDPSPIVVAASFRNLLWGMQADIAASDNAKSYDDAIARGLHSRHEDVISGALTAYASLHSLQADPVLRRYALDRRAGVRLGAITAYDFMMAYNKSIMAFLETRLSDPSVDVRDRVMLELMRMGDEHALPAIDKIARTAPTAEERASAAAYARTIRKDALANRP